MISEEKMASNVKGKKFYIDTLGCSKNQVDSEFLAGCLLRSGFVMTSEVHLANYLIVNTCGFIGDAMEESVNALLEYGAMKEPHQTLIAAGCLSERFAEDIRREMPEVDMIVGVTRFLELPEMIAAYGKDAHDSIRVGDIDRYVRYDEKERVLLNPGHYAYVKISEGCDNRCTYCTIPGFKGKYKSRTMEDIVREAENLARRGVKEIILIAQDTTKYGMDIYNAYRLGDLLEKLVDVKGIEWIRILYAYPDVIDKDLIDTIQKHDKICNYLDIPIQHSNDVVLKAMNRHTTAADIDKVIHMIRRAIPDMAIRTTLMVGFPGESQKAFEELLDFVKSGSFDRLGVFEYSPEDGTPAASFKNQVAPKIKERRKNQLMSLQQKISENNNMKKIGKQMKILIDEKVADEDVYLGRSEYDAPEVDGIVYVNTAKILAPGDFVEVVITDALEYDLIGEIADESAQ